MHNASATTERGQECCKTVAKVTRTLLASLPQSFRSSVGNIDGQGSSSLRISH